MPLLLLFHAPFLSDFGTKRGKTVSASDLPHRFLMPLLLPIHAPFLSDFGSKRGMANSATIIFGLFRAPCGKIFA